MTPRRATAYRAAAACLLLIAIFFWVPVTATDDHDALRWVATAVGLAAVVWLIAREMRRVVNDPAAPFTRLLLAVIAGLLAFALLDYIIAIRYPGSFVALNTRVDALYFALETMTTVGFGDVHAESQAARILVCVQMVFNLIIIGSAATLLADRVRTRARQQRHQTDTK